jgi:hypothetical protein
VGSAELCDALRRRYPWVAHTDIGPRAVEAGECDRCQAEVRMVEPCGPLPDLAVPASRDWALGRRCVAELGEEAWCDGHQAEGAAARRWLACLPDEADDVARLWWVATGEVRVDPELVERLVARLGLPPSTATA